MGFLSKIFGKREKIVQEEPKSESVLITELSSWYLSKTKERFKDIEYGLTVSINKIRAQEPIFKGALRKLKDATLLNPRVTEKEIQMMDGNRVAYLQQCGLLLSKLEVPPDINYRSVLDFLVIAKESFESFTKSTGRNVNVLRHFFNNQITDVNLALKVYTDELEKLDSILNNEENGVVYADRTNSKINSLLAKIKRQQELISEIDELRQKLDFSLQMKTKFSKDIERIKSLPEYEEFERLSGQKLRVLEDQKQLESDLGHVFSQLDRPLRKYSRVAIDDLKIIEDYINDSVSGLVSDREFRILNVLKALKSSIESGSVMLKDSDKEKAVQRIENINKEFLSQFVFRYDDLKKSRRQIDEKMSNNNLMRKMDDFTYKMEHAESNISRLEGLVKGVEEKIEKLAVERVKEDLQRELRAVLGTDVEILIESRKKGELS